MRPAFEPAAGNGRAHPHETTHRSIEADVAIIGAGPVGLMIANILGLQGVRVVVIEKLAQIIDYPRAIGLDDEALRVFQSVGLVDALLPHTTPNHWMRFTLKGKCFASIEPRTDEFGWPRRNAFIQPLAEDDMVGNLQPIDPGGVGRAREGEHRLPVGLLVGGKIAQVNRQFGRAAHHDGSSAVLKKLFRD